MYNVRAGVIVQQIFLLVMFIFLLHKPTSERVFCFCIYWIWKMCGSFVTSSLSCQSRSKRDCVACAIHSANASNGNWKFTTSGKILRGSKQVERAIGNRNRNAWQFTVDWSRRWADYSLFSLLPPSLSRVSSLTLPVSFIFLLDSSCMRDDVWMYVRQFNLHLRNLIGKIVLQNVIDLFAYTDTHTQATRPYFIYLLSVSFRETFFHYSFWPCFFRVALSCSYSWLCVAGS